jgi:hypothetical protein
LSPSRLPPHTVFDNGAQDISDTPRLCETSTRAVRRISIENLGNMVDTGFGQVTGERLKPRSNLIMNLLPLPFTLKYASKNGANNLAQTGP